jgi:transcriptional regulator with XRE-family HTH domain
MDDVNSFGLVLQNMRKTAGFSQEQLALECGLDRSFISLLERGRRQPTLKTILQLLDTMNVRITDFAIQLEKARNEN